ncbi:hypothetical protein CFU_2653 [Collimonas fungivorans Ter331]|uniref:Uncharacterized protein n=1 Tax=Collimonas fungivorans (strain Ter331) TaxID=1005048 RepID=G0ACC5_COLFT|nr:hypothetical protein CFU_2653 [Collimonas fungivorans Ter331]
MATTQSMFHVPSRIVGRSIHPDGWMRQCSSSRIGCAVNFAELLIEIGEAWHIAWPEPVQDREIRFVQAVHAPMIAVGAMSDVLLYQMPNTWWASANGAGDNSSRRAVLSYFD